MPAVFGFWQFAADMHYHAGDLAVVAAFFAGAAWSESRWAKERELLLSSPFDHNVGMTR